MDVMEEPFSELPCKALGAFDEKTCFNCFWSFWTVPTGVFESIGIGEVTETVVDLLGWKEPALRVLEFRTKSVLIFPAIYSVLFCVEAIILRDTRCVVNLPAKDDNAARRSQSL
jgi:hypothetical protein